MGQAPARQEEPDGRDLGAGAPPRARLRRPRTPRRPRPQYRGTSRSASDPGLPQNEGHAAHDRPLHLRRKPPPEGDATERPTPDRAVPEGLLGAEIARP